MGGEGLEEVDKGAPLVDHDVNQGGNVEGAEECKAQLLQECKATLNEKNDKFERSQTCLLARTAQMEAIIGSKDEQIKAASAKDERMLTLETTLERRDQELALKEKEILAIVSTLRSKDQKITNLEATLRNSKPIDVMDLISDMEAWTAPTSPPVLFSSAPAWSMQKWIQRAYFRASCK